MHRVAALVRRDLKRQWLSKSWLVLTVVEPTSYLLVFALVFSRQIQAIASQGMSLPYVAFVIPGLLALQTIQMFHVQVSLSSGDRRWGVLLLSSMAGMRPAEYVLAHAISRGSVAFLQSGMILAVGSLVTPLDLAPASALRVLMGVTAWTSSVILWTSVGVMVGARVASEQKRDILWSLLNLPLMFTSSAFYEVKQGPAVIAALSRLNPLTYCADTLRSCLYNERLAVSWELALLVFLAVAAAALCPRVLASTSLLRQPGN
jgi:ABC-2 type transport system permease protein